MEQSGAVTLWSGKPPPSSPELLQLCWGSRSRAVTLEAVSGFTHCDLCYSLTPDCQDTFPSSCSTWYPLAPDCQDPFHLSHNACTDCRLNSSPEAYFFSSTQNFLWKMALGIPEHSAAPWPNKCQELHPLTSKYVCTSYPKTTNVFSWKF